MAAVTRSSEVVVRAAQPGEGRPIARLWRELWDAHEAWGGYPGSHDERVYDQLAARLEQDARLRAGHPVLGRHAHLIAWYRGEVAGQVEGWFERHGVELTTPYTLEVRSLIVRESLRGVGAGRALLESLAQTGLTLSHGAAVVLAAEVLEPNPAHAFYARVGYAPVAWSARIEARDALASPVSAYQARLAEPRDALPIALLESSLARRRRGAGDLRFDRPRAVDATFVGAIAAHIAQAGVTGSEPLELVVTDPAGAVRASASFMVNALEPPFVPMKRAMVGRFALDPGVPEAALTTPLVSLGCRLALARGAAAVELTDLTSPGTPLYEAVRQSGARPWSRVVTRAVGLA